MHALCGYVSLSSWIPRAVCFTVSQATCCKTHILQCSIDLEQSAFKNKYSEDFSELRFYFVLSHF